MGNKKIALIGLGYVGLPLAVEFGKKNVQLLVLILTIQEFKSYKLDSIQL